MRSTKLIYVAGPLRGNLIKKWWNIYKAKRIAELFWRHGIAVYSPHLNSGWLNTPETDEFVLPANIDIMGRCDALYIMKNWRKSKGTKLEIRAAIGYKMPIFFSFKVTMQYIDRLQDWVDILDREEIIESI